MELVKHETCQQYVARRLSEGWSIVWQKGYHLILSSPDGNILRPVDLRNDIETLRPSAAGDETSIGYQQPAETFHWDKVDEAEADEGTTYIYEPGFTYKRDLYNLPASTGSGTINFIKIYFRAKSYSGTAKAKPSFKSNSTVTDGTEINIDSSWTTYSEQWNTNPADDEAWEWADIDALQIGVSLKAYEYDGMCTQVYVEVDYTPPAIPDPPTNVAATDGVHTDKVVITWTKSDGATDYQVKRDGTPLGWLGDVATFDDTGAGAPTVTPGDADASDGTSPDHVSLSLSGQSANNGATHTYVVEARTNGGESSGDSDSDTGYRGVGSLTYQWQRSAADSDADYSNIDGATTASYNDTGAPADGSGRYYRCVVSAEGA